MARTAEHVDRREESKVDRLIRRVYEETKAKLSAELAPVEGDFRKILTTLQEVRNLIEVLIGQKFGDHPVCNINDPREFFAEAQRVRSTEIRELVSGERLAALLAHYDEVAAVVKPLRVAIAKVNELLGVEDEEAEVPVTRWSKVGRRKSEAADEESPRDVGKSIIAWIARHGSIRINGNCAKQLRFSRSDIDTAIAYLLAQGKIKEIGGNDQQGRKYDLASEGGRDGSNGVDGDGFKLGNFKYEGPRPAIARAICEKLRTADVFVNSGDFCREVDCHPPASLEVVKALIEAGILTKDGSGRSTTYPITTKGRTLIRGSGNAEVRA